MQRNGTPLILLVVMQAGTDSLENSMKVPQEVKHRATLQCSNYTTRYLSQRYKCSDRKGHLYPEVHSSNSQTVERADKSINR